MCNILCAFCAVTGRASRRERVLYSGCDAAVLLSVSQGKEVSLEQLFSVLIYGVCTRISWKALWGFTGYLWAFVLLCCEWRKYIPFLKRGVISQKLLAETCFTGLRVSQHEHWGCSEVQISFMLAHTACATFTLRLLEPTVRVVLCFRGCSDVHTGVHKDPLIDMSTSQNMRNEGSVRNDLQRSPARPEPGPLLNPYDTRALKVCAFFALM